MAGYGKPEWRRRIAKFDGVCRGCRKNNVKEGDEIYWHPTFGTRHIECYFTEYSPQGGPQSARDAAGMPESDDNRSHDIPDSIPENSHSNFQDDMPEGNAERAGGQNGESEAEDNSQQPIPGAEPRAEPIPWDKVENPYREGSRNHEMFEDAKKNNGNPNMTANDAEEKTRQQQEPFIYSENRDGERIPKGIDEQVRLSRRDAIHMADKARKERQRQSMDPNSQSIPEENKGETENTPQRMTRELYLRHVRHLRDFCERSKNEGQFIDSISMRPITEGLKADKAGIPLEFMLNNITLHWADVTRDAAGVLPFDITNYAQTLPRETGQHTFYPVIKKLAEARIPIMLVGEKGTGKSFVAQQLAEDLGLDYGYVSLNGASTPSWFFGNWTPDPEQPYKTRPLRELYRKGGVFCIDEIDAGEPNMLLVLNNLLSSDILDCPMTGEKIEKHPDFIVIATANTFGIGANREYRGRERLDAATLDRFRMGRVVFPFDQNLEADILFERI